MSNADESPLVSVVMATYAGDSPDHLAEAVESVLRQTHRAIELMVVADGPLPVESQAYLSERAQQDARIILLSLPVSRGPAAARNLAIARAKGNFIAILDADDRALPYRLELQLKFLQESGADVVGSAYSIIDQHGHTSGVKAFPCEAHAIRRAIAFYNPIANSTVMAKSEALKSHPYPETFRYGEDYSLWITLARAGFVLRNQPEALVEFRMDSRFLSRRRGVHRATTELVNKLRTMPLYPAFLWPLVFCAAFGIAATRLLPTSLLSPFYWLRSKLA